MTTAGEFLHSFLPMVSSQPFRFYYLGVGSSMNGTYEEGYQRIAAQLGAAGRRVTRVGITLDGIYADPEGPCYRGADFEDFAIGDVASMASLDGLLMVPDVARWTAGLELPLAAAVRFLSYVGRGGLLLTHLSFLEQELNVLQRALINCAEPDNVVPLENPRFGPAIVIRKE